MDDAPQMAEQATDVWTFCRAVFSELGTYLGYGGGAVLLAVCGYLTGRVPPFWLWSTIVPLGFLVGAFRAWQKERSGRNEKSRQATKLKQEIDELGRPQFDPEITEVVVDDDHQQPDWIKLYVYLAIRNRGAQSTIDRWKLKVVPPQPANYFIQTEKGWLSGLSRGRGDQEGEIYYTTPM